VDTTVLCSYHQKQIYLKLTVIRCYFYNPSYFYLLITSSYNYLNMSKFIPNKVFLRGVLLHYFHMNKTAAESHRILEEVYGEQVLAEQTCRKWFARFKSGDFDLEDKERPGQPKKFEDKELEALLEENSSQTLEELSTSLGVDLSTVGKRLKALGMIQKEGNWVPYELKPRDVERRFLTCELLLQRYKRKSFLHRIVTGEKWIYYDNPKRRKSWVKPGQPSSSVPKRNIHGSKLLLCIWWDQRGVVYYELLNPNETITRDRYRLQLMRLSRALKEKRPEWSKRHDKIILLHDNARPHLAKPVQTYLQTLKWEVLTHPPYSPDVAPFDYHSIDGTRPG